MERKHVFRWLRIISNNGMFLQIKLVHQLKTRTYPEYINFFTSYSKYSLYIENGTQRGVTLGKTGLMLHFFS